MASDPIAEANMEGWCFKDISQQSILFYKNVDHVCFTKMMHFYDLITHDINMFSFIVCFQAKSSTVVGLSP